MTGVQKSGRLVTRVIKFCRMVTNILGSSVWNLLRVVLLAPRILRWLLEFRKICGPLP
jgi:hypothetical protein